MVTLAISETLAEKITRRAKAQQLSVEELLDILVEELPVNHQDVDEFGNTVEDRAIIESLIGCIDSELTDLSATTSETRDRYYQERFGHADSD